MKVEKERGGGGGSLVIKKDTYMYVYMSLKVCIRHGCWDTDLGCSVLHGHPVWPQVQVGVTSDDILGRDGGITIGVYKYWGWTYMYMVVCTYMVVYMYYGSV